MGLDLKSIVGSLIPSNYTVGGKTTKSSGIPVDVKLSIDPEFKKTLIKSVAILSVGIGAGISAGIVIAETKKRRRA